MGRIIVNPHAAMYGAERNAPRQYGRDTMRDVGQVLDATGKVVQIGSILGNELVGPALTGLYNRGVEGQVQDAASGLGRAQAARSLLQGGAERGLMAADQPQREAFGRRGMEEALPPPVAQPDETPLDEPAVPYQLPSMMTGMMQRGYQNPYRMRMPAADPADDARARAADLMLGRGSLGQLGQGGGMEAFDQQPLNWGHQAPQDRRSILPKRASQDPMGVLSPFMGLVPQQDEQLPQGLFNAPQSNAMPRPGTPEFRAMLEQQQPQTENMTAGLGDSAMGLLRRAGLAPAAAPARRPAPRGPATPGLQQRADAAQAGVGVQMAAEAQKAQDTLNPAIAQVDESIATSDEMQALARQRMADSKPDDAELALQDRLNVAQQRKPMRVEQYDYSLPQLEALIIEAKQSGDQDSIKQVADAINNSSMRGARAQSVFADMLGGAHVGRERQRLLGNLMGATPKQESTADLASELSKASYNRIMGERMQGKGLEFIDKSATNQGKSAMNIGKAQNLGRSQAARNVSALAGAEKAQVEAEAIAPRTKAQMAASYGSANQANANAKQIKTMLPWKVALANKKLHELPKEGKGFSLNIGGKGATTEQAKFIKEVWRQGDLAYKEAGQALAKLAPPPDEESIPYNQYGKMYAKWVADNQQAIALAASALARANRKRSELKDAELPTGEKLADYLSMDAAQTAHIERLAKTAAFQDVYKLALTKPATGSTGHAKKDDGIAGSE